MTHAPTTLQHQGQKININLLIIMLIKTDDIDFLTLMLRHAGYHVVIIPDAELLLLAP